MPEPLAPAEDAARMERTNAVHEALLAQWRKAMDLVGPGPLAPHFIDAAGAVRGLPAAGRWVDLGSGAGFPGVALAGLFPGLAVELVESRQKRATFLEKVVRDAGLSNARAICCRSEELSPGAYDGLISRAYKPPEAVLAEDGARLLRPGGLAVLLLGDGGPMVAPPGWERTEELRYAVPDGHRRRVVLRRIG
jgi:16S rRNA (guanine527-N7)-methyltransferase